MHIIYMKNGRKNETHAYYGSVKIKGIGDNINIYMHAYTAVYIHMHMLYMHACAYQSGSQPVVSLTMIV